MSDESGTSPFLEYVPFTVRVSHRRGSVRGGSEWASGEFGCRASPDRCRRERRHICWSSRFQVRRSQSSRFPVPSSKLKTTNLELWNSGTWNLELWLRRNSGGEAQTTPGSPDCNGSVKADRQLAPLGGSWRFLAVPGGGEFLVFCPGSSAGFSSSARKWGRISTRSCQ